MRDKTEKKRLAILKLLQETGECLSSSKLTRQLQDQGHDVSGRTVRLYLLELDREGLTKNYGKRGRKITPRGSKELSAVKTYEKVGFMAAKIDQLAYNMTFDLDKKSGSVITNVSMLPLEKVKRSVPLIKKVFSAGYAMGQLLTLFQPGARVGELTVPDDCLGVGTVCSVTLNGVLLSHGIPTKSRYGGLLEIQDRQPRRFVELINYEGTTIDPLEIFIRTGMTDYIGATGTGNGRIGAGFREIPADSRTRVVEIAERLNQVGLGGFMTIGWPGQPLLDIPVSEGRAGAVVIGGLNPIAILEEDGIRVQSRALASLVDYQALFPYRELDQRAKSHL
ncbi:MAG: NrpR regulatory domain-containing protein [candidate division FCPU426 bacterium]